MDLLGYIDKFGIYPFSERPFNDVDALILAQLSYINFDLVAPSINDVTKKPFYLKDINPRFISHMALGELTSSKNSALLTKLKSSIRFRKIGICYVEKDESIKTEKQFFGMTMILPDGVRYLSFRGTDLTLYGWKEDCNMAFLEEVPAQQSTVDYVYKVTKLFDDNFYLGGHSKGGNLSFYAALKLDSNLQKRCLKAYSFDGPGFYNKEAYASAEYQQMEQKLVKIVPHDSLIGIVLNNTKNAKVVEARSLSVLQHDSYNWVIDETIGDFKLLKKRANDSYINERALSTWLDSLTKEEVILTTNCIFELLGGTNKTLSQLMRHTPQTIATFLKVQLKYSKEQKEKLTSILKRLFYYHKKARQYYKEQEKKRRLEQRKLRIEERKKGVKKYA